MRLWHDMRVYLKSLVLFLFAVATTNLAKRTLSKVTRRRRKRTSSVATEYGHFVKPVWDWLLKNLEGGRIQVLPKAIRDMVQQTITAMDDLTGEVREDIDDTVATICEYIKRLIIKFNIGK